MINHTVIWLMFCSNITMPGCMSVCEPRKPYENLYGLFCQTHHKALIWHQQTTIHSFHWHVKNKMIPCRSQELLHSSLLYTLSFHHFPPTNLPSSLTSFCHLFLGPPLSLIVSKFVSNTFLEILFSSILCTCPNQCNLFNLFVSVIVNFLTTA